MEDSVSEAPRLNLPTGTQIVTRGEVLDARAGTRHPRGSVGVIVAVPSSRMAPYRVRFPDGSEAEVRRELLSILKHAQRDVVEADGVEIDLHAYLIYQCVV